MSNTLGTAYRITVFGQSHAPAMGAIIDGLPAGIEIPYDEIEKQMRRRRPKATVYSTARQEEDHVRFLSGVVDGKTCGAPLCFCIENTDHKSVDYDHLRTHPRPGHADYPAYVKFNGYNDIAGGGQFSGRLTAPITVAGAIAKAILHKKGVEIGARIASIYTVEDNLERPISYEDIEQLDENMPVLNADKKEEMLRCIEAAKQEGDSVGGIVECYVFHMPAGIGEPLYDSVESDLAKALFSIPGMRGLSVGTGFAATRMRGSKHNDAYRWSEDGVVTETNHHGGILGGITTGMPIVFQVGFKPTASIAKKQQTVDLASKDNCELQVQGRHDACFVPRALVAVEMMTAITMLDLYMQEERL